MSIRHGHYCFMSDELVLGPNQRENLVLVKGSVVELKRAFRELEYGAVFR